MVVAARSSDPDLAPFVRGAHLGQSFVVWPREGEPLLGFLTPMERDEAAATGLRLLAPEALGMPALGLRSATAGELWHGLLAAALRQVGLDRGRIAIGGQAAAGTVYEACKRLESEGFELVSGHRALLRLRRRKSADEIAAVRHSAAGGVAAFRRVAELLADSRPARRGLELGGEPLTAGRLRSEIALVLARHGLEQPEGNIVASGRDAGVPHSQGSSDRVLEPGKAIVVDLYPKGGLFADCTRTFCVGEPPSGLERGHAEVVAALTAAHEAARPGVECWALQSATCERFAAAGYQTPLTHPGTVVGYVHGLGHGVGYELHELPSFAERRDGDGDVLAAGDVITLEPGLYDADAGWGVRLEDLCLVTDGGVENLSPLPYALDPRTW